MIWKKRIYKYDLLRAICIFEVILLHVGAGYTDSSYHSAITDLDYNIGMFFSLITRTSVPCFVMLSGAFMIRSSTVCLQDYYRKMKKKLIYPIIGFSIVYVLYSYSQIIAATILDVGISSELTNWYHPLRLLVEGKPHVIMWYAFMLIGLYVVTPIINWINSIVSNKMWYKLSIVLFCYSIVVHYTCSLSWILQFAEWIGYYMMGYSIRKICEDKTVSKICRRMLLVIGVVVLLINYILCLHGVSEVFAGESYFSFCNILATLLIFTGISQMQIRHEHAVVSKIAKNTLWIYMLHILFIDPVFQIWGRIFKVLPSAIFILIWATLVLFLCMSSLSMYRGVISVLSRGKEIKNE